MYVVLAEQFGGVHPCVYGLLPDKREATYDRFFEALRNLAPMQFEPTIINTDFEIGALNALRRTFPDAQLHGCFYHLTKNMKKQLAHPDVQLLRRYNQVSVYLMKNSTTI